LNKWHSRFMAMAKLVATWSKDDSTGVGAVIASPDKRIVSVGFNGYPKGVDDTILSREQKLARTIHAEANALHFANRDVSGCSIYITHPPCSHCAAHLIQRGIATIYSPIPDEHFMSRWENSLKESQAMFMQAGVVLYFLPNEY
jgi:dCMP deaminase